MAQTHPIKVDVNVRLSRPQALQQAEELVNRLSPVNNSRGYPDGADKLLSDRVANILRVADWLLDPSTDPIRRATVGLPPLETTTAGTVEVDL